MKILVFSDSHRNTVNLSKALNEHANTADLIIHLGDGTDDLTLQKGKLISVPIISVAGNYEELASSDARPPVESLLELNGVRMLCMHGHKYFVKKSLDSAINKAIFCNADLILFGHTHIPYDNTAKTPDGNIKIFNPGSIGRGYPPSYGIINIVNGVIVSSHRFM